MNDAQLLQYFQNQQTQSGWFALLHTMVENMVANVGESQSHAFLTQMGDDLGKRFPLPLSNTVGELETAINNQLARFNWGYIDIDASETALLIRHRALPTPSYEARQTAWSHAMSAVLEGLYARWLQSQGGKPTVALWRESAPSATEVHFRYQNSR